MWQGALLSFHCLRTCCNCVRFTVCFSYKGNECCSTCGCSEFAFFVRNETILMWLKLLICVSYPVAFKLIVTVCRDFWSFWQLTTADKEIDIMFLFLWFLYSAFFWFLAAKSAHLKNNVVLWHVCFESVKLLTCEFIQVLIQKLFFSFFLVKQTHKEISEQICILKSFSVFLFKACTSSGKIF